MLRDTSSHLRQQAHALDDGLNPTVARLPQGATLGASEQRCLRAFNQKLDTRAHRANRLMLDWRYTP